MKAPLGLDLLRDRRVALKPKLIALGAGLAVVGVVELLQIPLETVTALILPVVGAAGDIAVDGAEIVIGPLLIATLLMPRLAPPNIVAQLKAERATPVREAPASSPSAKPPPAPSEEEVFEVIDDDTPKRRR
jgi:hypothetical protein